MSGRWPPGAYEITVDGERAQVMTSRAVSTMTMLVLFEPLTQLDDKKIMPLVKFGSSAPVGVKVNVFGVGEGVTQSNTWIGVANAKQWLTSTFVFRTEQGKTYLFGFVRGYHAPMKKVQFDFLGAGLSAMTMNNYVNIPRASCDGASVARGHRRRLKVEAHADASKAATCNELGLTALSGWKKGSTAMMGIDTASYSTDIVALSSLVKTIKCSYITPTQTLTLTTEGPMLAAYKGMSASYGCANTGNPTGIHMILADPLTTMELCKLLGYGALGGTVQTTTYPAEGCSAMVAFFPGKGWSAQAAKTGQLMVRQFSCTKPNTVTPPAAPAPPKQTAKMVKCGDIPKKTVTGWGKKFLMMDVSAYTTNGGLKGLGCAYCGSLTCKDTSDSLTISGQNILSGVVGPMSSSSACASATNPTGVLNIGGDDASGAALCNQLGYKKALVTYRNSYNGWCPTVDWNGKVWVAGTKLLAHGTTRTMTGITCTGPIQLAETTAPPQPKPQEETAKMVKCGDIPIEKITGWGLTFDSMDLSRYTSGQLTTIGCATCKDLQCKDGSGTLIIQASGGMQGALGAMGKNNKCRSGIETNGMSNMDGSTATAKALCDQLGYGTAEVQTTAKKSGSCPGVGWRGTTWGVDSSSSQVMVAVRCSGKKTVVVPPPKPSGGVKCADIPMKMVTGWGSTFLAMDVSAYTASNKLKFVGCQHCGIMTCKDTSDSLSITGQNILSAAIGPMSTTYHCESAKNPTGKLGMGGDDASGVALCNQLGYKKASVKYRNGYMGWCPTVNWRTNAWVVGEREMNGKRVMTGIVCTEPIKMSSVTPPETKPKLPGSTSQSWHSVPISPASRVESCAIGRGGDMFGIRGSNRQVMGSAGYFGASKTSWDELTQLVGETNTSGIEFSRLAVQSPGCRIAVVDSSGGLWTGDGSALNISSVTLYKVAMLSGHSLTSVAFGLREVYGVTTGGDMIVTIGFPFSSWRVTGKDWSQVSARGDFVAGIKTLGNVVRMRGSYGRLMSPEEVANPAPGKVKYVSIGIDGDMLAIANDAKGVLSAMYWMERGEKSWNGVPLPNVQGLPAKVDMDSQNRVCLTTEAGKLYTGALSRTLTQKDDQMMWVRSNGSSCPLTCDGAKLSAVSVDSLNSESGTSTSESSYVCASSREMHTSNGEFVGWNDKKKGGCTIPGVSLTTIFKEDADFDCLCRNDRETKVRWAEMEEDCRDCEDACNKVELSAVQTKQEFLDIGAINVCAARDNNGVFRPGYNFHLMPGCYVSPMRTIGYVCICFAPKSMFPTFSPSRTPTSQPSARPTTTTTRPSNMPSSTPTEMPTSTCDACCANVCPASPPRPPPAVQEIDEDETQIV